MMSVAVIQTTAVQTHLDPVIEADKRKLIWWIVDLPIRLVPYRGTGLIVLAFRCGPLLLSITQCTRSLKDSRHWAIGAPAQTFSCDQNVGALVHSATPMRVEPVNIAQHITSRDWRLPALHCAPFELQTT